MYIYTYNRFIKLEKIHLAFLVALETSPKKTLLKNSINVKDKQI